jgi:hypothetical protein
MKRLSLLLALLPLTVFGAVNGSWRGQVEAMNPTTHKTYTVGLYANLTQNGTQLTGTAGGTKGMVPIQNASVTGSTLHFSVPHESSTKRPQPPGTTVYTLTPSGSNLVGTVTLWNHQTVNVTLVPSPPTK